ncbi:alpha/beta hydrolase [Pseudalkalibacillus hwajinpoensis]|uniref:Alpha/beta fold hydrolase n=1 Tax=Guptibacillus hwajinpoensis TaxID=208199 RepID=A0A4U1MNM0_9BACL|nr:alpha/beta fold hydrolase [Pseudalkalibacillus hwajinpoensis]TKD72424.1 alpha/beta fold hydrolase [Pseudalkalibacillus hwajinpoensis]
MSNHIHKGAEPFHMEGNQIGVLVLHGFTGSTQSMRGLGEELASEGYTVCGPRLKGHGTHYEDMEQSTYKEWIQSVEEGYQWLNERCEQIFITGLSMGGTLTLYLAEQHPEVKGIMPINAAIDLPELEQMRGKVEPRFLDAIGSDIKAEGVEELAYEKTPMKSIQEILQLIDLTQNELGSIKMPALLFKSLEDHVVPPENTERIYEGISSEDKEIIELTDSYHVATLDHDKGEIAEKCKAFIKKLSR